MSRLDAFGRDPILRVVSESQLSANGYLRATAKHSEDIVGIHWRKAYAAKLAIGGSAIGRTVDTEFLSQIDPVTPKWIARIRCLDLYAIAVVVSVFLFVDHLKYTRLR